MKVKDIPVTSAIIKSHQNKVKKLTMKQTMKVMNINDVTTVIIKQDGKRH